MKVDTAPKRLCQWCGAIMQLFKGYWVCKDCDVLPREKP